MVLLKIWSREPVNWIWDQEPYKLWPRQNPVGLESGDLGAQLPVVLATQAELYKVMTFFPALGTHLKLPVMMVLLRLHKVPPLSAQVIAQWTQGLQHSSTALTVPVDKLWLPWRQKECRNAPNEPLASEGDKQQVSLPKGQDEKWPEVAKSWRKRTSRGWSGREPLSLGQ